MAVTATRTTTITYSNDVVGSEALAAAPNTNSPGQIQVYSGTVGFHAIPVPLAGTIPTALTIIPPAGNTNALTLKGVTGDTGIRIHNTDPTTIALDPSVTTVGLAVATATTNLRLMWT